MKVYLVGGAVRDALLGRPVHDRDFVVVGAHPNDLLSQGFTQVGADFPVFLHPHTHQEYALARTERKSGQGYQGFSVTTDGVSLQDDLARRDLTINALAVPVLGLFDDTPTGGVIDPYGGRRDLDNRCLRHVSGAFSEDPLRVLRVARFYARFYELGFTVAPDTMALMQSIAERGELSYLSRERIWIECQKALNEKDGFAFFKILFELNILPHILPELAAAWRNDTIRQNTFHLLKKAHDKPSHLQFALLVSGLLEEMDQIKNICERLLTPKMMMQFTQLLSKHLTDFVNIDDISADALVTLIEDTKAQKDMTVLLQLADTVAIMTGKTISDEYFKDIIALYQSISIHDIHPSLKGRDIGDELRRLRAIKIQNRLAHLP